MKSIKFLVIACLLLISFKSYSVVHVINQTGSTFSPSSLTVNVGDVIHWVWSSGTHTTTSGNIPAGALSWNSDLTSTKPTFDYTVTVAGSYAYVCLLHESMGMVASFTAVATTGIAENELSRTISVFPNPAQSFINIKTGSDGEILLSNILGKSIKKYQLKDLPQLDESYQLDLSDLSGGIYIISYLPTNSKKRISLKFIKE